MKRRNVRTLSLVVVTFTYLLIGAAVFDALEGPHNDMSYKALVHIRGSFVKKYNMSQDDYKIFELMMIEKRPHENGPQWKFSGSLYYALVVLALIGYGHSTPNTYLGKAATMVYAMVGIPMAMVMFQSMGERMNKFFSVVIRRIRTWTGAARTEANEFDLIVASGFTSGLVMHCGAVMYSYQEGWSFFDSLYYSFITLSTIGFGDYVALQSDKALHNRHGYVVCSFLFLLVGLACFASSVNLLVLRFMILSLEEEEEGELQDVAQNVVTLDGEVSAMAVRNEGGGGIRVSPPHMGRPVPPFDPAAYLGGNKGGKSGFRRPPSVASVCSCTCYGDSKTFKRGRSSSSGHNPATSVSEFSTQWRGRGRQRSRGKRKSGKKVAQPWLSRFTGFVRRSLGMAPASEGTRRPRGEETSSGNDNYYDEETQSISNYNRYAVKRASM